MFNDRLQKILRRTSNAEAQRSSDQAGISPLTGGGGGIKVTSALFRGSGGHAVGAKAPLVPLVDKHMGLQGERIADRTMAGIVLARAGDMPTSLCSCNCGIIAVRRSLVDAVVVESTLSMCCLAKQLVFGAWFWFGVMNGGRKRDV